MQTMTAEMKALGAGEGEMIRFLGSLATVKATGEETGEAFSLSVHLVPAGFGPPPHCHHVEDEAFFVLDGEISGFCADRPFRGGPGSYFHLPHGLVHAFKVEGDAPARLLVITTPAGFERFCREAGEPATTAEIPPAPVAAEIEKMLATAPRFGIEIMPPA